MLLGAGETWLQSMPMHRLGHLSTIAVTTTTKTTQVMLIVSPLGHRRPIVMVTAQAAVSLPRTTRRGLVHQGLAHPMAPVARGLRQHRGSVTMLPPRVSCMTASSQSTTPIVPRWRLLPRQAALQRNLPLTAPPSGLCGRRPRTRVKLRSSRVLLLSAHLITVPSRGAPSTPLTRHCRVILHGGRTL